MKHTSHTSECQVQKEVWHYLECGMTEDIDGKEKGKQQHCSTILQRLFYHYQSQQTMRCYAKGGGISVEL